jgi:hypothetical protein
MDDRLVFSGVMGSLGLLIFVLPVIHDPADRRAGIGSHLHQVQTLFFGDPHSLFQGQDPDLFTV